MKNFVEPEDALMEARSARHQKDANTEAFFLGYASGLTEAYRGVRRDPALQMGRDDYARGYSAGYGSVADRREVGSRTLSGMGRPMARTPVFANRRTSKKGRRSSRRSSRRGRR